MTDTMWTDPDGAALGRAAELRLAGRPRDALRALVGLPPTATVLIEQARCLDDLDERGDAYRLGAEAVAAAPDDIDVLLPFVHIARSAGAPEAALAAAEQALALSPDELPTLLTYATEAAHWPEHEDRAARAISAAIDLAPNHPVVASTFGDVLLGTGRYAAAVQAYDGALRLDPADEHALQNRAAAQLALGRETASTSGFWSVVHDRPDNAPAVRGLRRSVLGTLQRLRVVVGGSAIAGFFAGVPLGAPGPTLLIALTSWLIAAALIAIGVVLVARAMRQNREPLVRLLRGSTLLRTVAVLLAVAAALVLLAPALPFAFPWPPLAAFALVAVCSALSFVLHYQAAPPAPGRRRTDPV
ncbi:hypothetical protein [Curtobacterium luteum]|uniref:hypothetical protein n=1 Tax=Curtobacterium luteum TaxID=33881 RepID=UPI00381A1432